MDYELTTPTTESKNLDALTDFTTAGMVSYGLRHGGTEAEYDLALRLQAMREACLDMVTQMKSEGYLPSEKHLKLMDVQIPVMAKERLTL